ncbi:alpha/beta hydrolase-fold protein [Sandarakinorhabdus oryzae]|uniref:alpha/beta hydrolase-fold protein n=1 Tax=Sandarakinorhabdus oryzae TaxID=2675220 RepID=UPI0018CBFAAF|nr:alpha/beta hydrolase-fold protein [Sandarakinorhabdus oryzae]
MRNRVMGRILTAALISTALAMPAAATGFRVTLPATGVDPVNDGRIILIITPDASKEPRFQVRLGADAPQVFGVNVDGLKPGGSATVASGVLGFPIDDVAQVPAGEYMVQAVFHKYTTYHLATGHTVKLPAARGAGQNWREEPGNIISEPVKIRFNPASKELVTIPLTKVIPPVEQPKDSEFIRHFKFRSERLSRFWGTDVFITGHVLVPRDFDKHPEARFPLVINHGHFPSDFGGFSTTPPDLTEPCKPEPRFNEPCYNRIQAQEAFDLYKRWTSDNFPRFLIVEIDHSNPYYDDSYAVNSANLGPYGDAIMKEFVPALEAKFRGLGQGWARFTYGGSTGGWEALAVQLFYPDDFNGAFAACPDPVDFREYTGINLYADKNAFWKEGPFTRIPRPAHRDYLGHVAYTVDQEQRLELVLGDHSRSGQQYDIWEAVYSPQGPDGYPQRIFDKRTGVIDPKVAAYWRENYDLVHIMQRDWKTLGPKVKDKIFLYAGDMDNYYLNNAVYLAEDFLKKANPPFTGEIAYGDRAEHCWNGDPNQPNHISRLRYHTMYVDKMLKRIQAAAPKGADLTSWRY